MTPSEFAAKWQGSMATERAGAQEHFIDLFRMLGWPTPNDDPTDERYAFEKGAEKTGGRAVSAINANLTAGIDLTTARPLTENLGIAFMGDTKGGSFDLPGEVAYPMLYAHNPDGRSNRNVIRPWVNGLDVTRRDRGMFIVDFGTKMARDEAALYEAPFEYIRQHVEPLRTGNKRAAYAERWWLHVEPRTGMRAALAGLERYIGTPRVAKHRLFVWLRADTLPDSQIIVFARDDDYTFGVLHSRMHEVWARGTGTQLREVESGFRYTPTTTFETFPFPYPTDEQRDGIAAAARRLDELRRGWLDPLGADEEGRGFARFASPVKRSGAKGPRGPRRRSLTARGILVARSSATLIASEAGPRAGLAGPSLTFRGPGQRRRGPLADQGSSSAVRQRLTLAECEGHAARAGRTSVDPG